MFAWIFATTALVGIAISLFSVPWTALMAELSDDYAERTEIVVWRYAVGWIGGLAFTFSVWTFIFPATPAFPRGQLNADNYVLFAPVLAVCVGLAALVATQLTRREIPFLVQPAAASSFSLRRMIDELFSMLSNRDFLVLFMGALLSACIGAPPARSKSTCRPTSGAWDRRNCVGSAWPSSAQRPPSSCSPHATDLGQEDPDVGLLWPAAAGRGDHDQPAAAGGAPGQWRASAADSAAGQYDLPDLPGHRSGVMFISMLADSWTPRSSAMASARRACSPRPCRSPPRPRRVWGPGRRPAAAERDPMAGGQDHRRYRPRHRLPPGPGGRRPRALAYVAPLLVGMGYRITREAHAEIRRQVAAQRLSSFGHDPDPPAAPPTTANTPWLNRPPLMEQSISETVLRLLGDSQGQGGVPRRKTPSRSPGKGELHPMLRSMGCGKSLKTI
uniref:MFS transporter n=1 Tax=Phenylobacterium glaciei TaxID=2803784 RepID=A0A974P7K5_9CAUL|nr:MFS transporter [Phenylobacterium glaciei]